jgi:glucose-6-phosphate isomerase
LGDKNDLKFEVENYPELQKKMKISAEIIQKNRKIGEAFLYGCLFTAIICNCKKCEPFLVGGKIKNMIILGTGGSVQTALALSGLFKVKLYPIVSSRPYEIKRVLEQCNPENTIVLPISRGGKTLDTNSTIEIFKDYPMIGLASQGPMFEFLKKKNVPIVDVPDLSGRFAASVCSVGLIPGIIGGINIKEFLDYQDEAYKLFKNLEQPDLNPALQLATYFNILYNNGYRNIFSMPYSSYLEGAVGLFVQEISESSGKEDKGILGTSQPAPLCQHSVLELLMGGSKGHTSPLLWTSENEPEDISINNPSFSINNQTGLSIINYQADATFQALISQNVPSSKISVKNIDLKSLSQLIALIQTTVYYYCMLTNVNWESNPLVVVGKEICNKAMKENKDFIQRRLERKSIAKDQFRKLKFNL